MPRLSTFTLAILLIAATPAGATRPTKARPLKTGQESSYGASGDVTAGLSRMYNDLGNGVIKDQRTGLFWEKKSDNGSIHDKDDTYTWTSGTEIANGTVFTVFLAALNKAPCFAGYCDWRLPTTFELFTLASLGDVDPAMPPQFHAGCTNGCSSVGWPPLTVGCTCASSGRHWTSSTNYLLPDRASVVFFLLGEATFAPKTESHHVRAVRGGGS
ncbi:MAG: DUF1566 domain-containing protein [Alphaproteobacteria bacterium]